MCYMPFKSLGTAAATGLLLSPALHMHNSRQLQQQQQQQQQGAEDAEEGLACCSSLIETISGERNARRNREDVREGDREETAIRRCLLSCLGVIDTGRELGIYALLAGANVTYSGPLHRQTEAPKRLREEGETKCLRGDDPPNNRMYNRRI